MAKQKIKIVLITIIVSIILTFIFLLYGANYSLKGWINVTFSTGVIIFGFGVLLFSTKEGLFDIMVYGTKKFITYIFRRKNKVESYYEYYTKNREKERLPISYFIYIGLVYIGLSLTLLFGFYY